MLGAWLFILREYISRTQIFYELILTFIFYSLINSNTDQPDILSAITLSAMIIGNITVYRIISRWLGSTRDIYVLSIGRLNFEAAILLSGVFIAEFCCMILYIVAVFESNLDLKLTDILTILIEPLLAGLISAFILSFFKSRSLTPVLISFSLNLIGYVSPGFDRPFYYYGYIVPLSYSTPILVKLFSVAVLIYILKLRINVKDYI